jgi:hypothetical protein
VEKQGAKKAGDKTGLYFGTSFHMRGHSERENYTNINPKVQKPCRGREKNGARFAGCNWLTVANWF